MKEKKLSLLSNTSSSSSSNLITEPEDQYELYVQHKEPIIPMDFTIGNFLTLPSNHSDDSSKNDSLFVRTIDSVFESRAKLIQQMTSDEEGCCSPRVLIICSGARRGCDVINILSRSFKCKIGKLFAKHFRIQEQIEVLKSTYFPIAVGTPNRLYKLIEMGALSLTDTSLVIVDLYEDVKGFHVMTLSDTKKDFYNFMSNCCSKEKDHLKIACIKDSSVTTKNNNFHSAQSNNKFNNARLKINKKKQMKFKKPGFK
jgi:hypothetical protein